MIAVFGGAFNPPTIAHYEVAKHLLGLPFVESLLFVPVGDHYNKAGLIPAFHRVKMLEIMVSNLSNARISKVEIDAVQALKTLETLEKIQNKYPKEQLAFVMGADNLCGLTNWYKYEKLIEMFKIIIVNRGEVDVYQLIEEKFSFATTNFLVIDDFIKMDISSSQYRDDLTKGELLLPAVVAYIEKHGLYRVLDGILEI